MCRNLGGVARSAAWKRVEQPARRRQVTVEAAGPLHAAIVGQNCSPSEVRKRPPIAGDAERDVGQQRRAAQNDGRTCAFMELLQHRLQPRPVPAADLPRGVIQHPDLVFLKQPEPLLDVVRRALRSCGDQPGGRHDAHQHCGGMDGGCAVSAGTIKRFA